MLGKRRVKKEIVGCCSEHVKLQSRKNKRKRNLIKKAHELALDTNLKVTLLIMDKSRNILQEFVSHADFTVEAICEWKSVNKKLTLDVEKYR